MPRLYRLTVAVVIASMPISALAQQRGELFVPANDVLLTVSTEQDAYQTGRKIWVAYTAVNVSHHPVFVPREWSATCPPKPHIWAWFENTVGQHFIPGYAGDCNPAAESVMKRMAKEAVLLKPGQRLAGKIKLETNLFGGLTPGKYRIEVALYGWKEDEFDQKQRSELEKMGAPLMRGEVPASTSVTLTP